MIIIKGLILSLILCIVFYLYTLYRNELVANTKYRLINEFYNKYNSGTHNNFNDLLSIFRKYSYDKMFWQLFKFKWTLKEIVNKEEKENGIPRSKN